MDRIKIVFDDGQQFKLPDVSFELFKQVLWQWGADDVEYDKHLQENGMKELTDFNPESTSEITLVVEQPQRGRVLKFKCVYDSKNDEEFDSKSYFKDEIV